jgi:hypothetical protein
MYIYKEKRTAKGIMLSMSMGLSYHSADFCWNFIFVKGLFYNEFVKV